MLDFQRSGRLTTLAAVLSLALALALGPAPASACDICAIYTASLMQVDRTGLSLGVAEQYSGMGSIQVDGRDAPNPANEYLDTSTTQFLAAWTFTPSIGVQATLPIIAREYRRLEEGTPTRGDVSGAGDLSIVGRYAPVSRSFGDVMVHLDLLAGLKLPTGSASRLAEEDEHHGDDDDHHEEEGQAAPHHDGEHEEQASGVHGHDLALGTGSVDGVFGAFAYGSWKRAFADATFQYSLRGNGAHGYEYADDTTWRVSLGAFLLTNASVTLALRGVVSGEHKDEDTHRGAKMDDTALDAVYVGPGLVATWKDRLRSELTVDLPVDQDSTGTQIVVDHRVRAALNWRF